MDLKILSFHRKLQVPVLGLLVLLFIGGACYIRQALLGLSVTGLSREVSWGLYIGQFVFFVGMAASAVMVVIPYALHDFKAYGQILIPAELLSIASLVVCLAFVIVDLGQPIRVLNVLIYLSPSSVLFWDMLVLLGYLLINLALLRALVREHRYRVPLPVWYRPLMILSIPWAIGIHTVTAFLLSALAGRPAWFSPLLAPRFLASAFVSGPTLLVLLLLVLERQKRLRLEPSIFRGLRVTIAYALAVHLFFSGVEMFGLLYSQTPEHLQVLSTLFVHPGLKSPSGFLFLMSYLLTTLAFVMLAAKTGKSHRGLALASLAGFLGILLEKGVSLVVSGFLITSFGANTSYFPTFNELGVVLGIWALGALTLTFGLKRTLNADTKPAISGVVASSSPSLL